MSLGNISLEVINPPLIVELEDGRLEITRRWTVSLGDTNSDRLKEKLFDPYGTLDGKSVVGDFPVPSYMIYATAVLTRQEVRHPVFRHGEGDPQQTHIILEKVYTEAAGVPITASGAAGAPAVGNPQYEGGPDGLLEVVQVFCNRAESDFTRGMVGVDIFTTEQGAGVLKEEKTEVTLAVRRVVRRYVISGLFQALGQAGADGTYRVTFKSVGGAKIIPTALNGAFTMSSPANQAFQGGAATHIIKDIIRDIAGLNTFEVTALMKYSGAALPNGSCNVTIKQYDDYQNYAIPGQVALGATGAGSSVDLNPIFTLIPVTAKRALKVQITESIQDATTAATTLATAPFFVQQWASLTLSWVDVATGLVRNIVKAFQGYLTPSGQTLAYTGGSINGAAATNISGAITSTPNSTGSYPYLSTSGKVLELRCTLAYNTAYGVPYYRVRSVVALT